MAIDEGQQAIEGISRRSVLRGGLLAGAGVATVGALSGVRTGTAEAATASSQPGWGFCVYCGVLWWFRGQTHSACPSSDATDGLHWVGAGNLNYVLDNNQAGLTNQSNPQPNWRWCSKCQGLFWGQSSSVCWGNGQSTHVFGSATSYDLQWTPPGPPSGKSNPQQYWSWCGHCHLLFYSGEDISIGGGVCPDGGGTHYLESVTDYYLSWSGTW